MDQIDTRLYNNVTINKKYFKDSIIFALVNDMIYICSELSRKQYIQLRKLLNFLCIDLHDRYCFNILRRITLLYNFYNEHDIYHMEYNKIRNGLNENIFIEGTMSKWDDYITLSEILRNMGH